MDHRPPTPTPPTPPTPPDPPGARDPSADAPPSPAKDRFPTIVLAGPGCIFLLLVLVGSGKAGGELLFPAFAALISSLCFGIIAARAKSDNARSIGVLLAFMGPVLFCLALMARV